jgi:hypothetical protein
MERISTLFGTLSRPTKPTKQTERGQLLDQFLSRLNPGRKAKGYPPLTIKRLAYKLTASRRAISMRSFPSATTPSAGGIIGALSFGKKLHLTNKPTYDT